MVVFSPVLLSFTLFPAGNLVRTRVTATAAARAVLMIPISVCRDKFPCVQTRGWLLVLGIFNMCPDARDWTWGLLTLSSPAVHAKYTPGNQQCWSTLQLRTSCAGVLHCRSLPAYIKLLYLLKHSPGLIHPCVDLKTVEWSMKWVVYFEIKVFVVIELMECICLVVLLDLFTIHSQ